MELSETRLRFSHRKPQAERDEETKQILQRTPTQLSNEQTLKRLDQPIDIVPRADHLIAFSNGDRRKDST